MIGTVIQFTADVSTLRRIKATDFSLSKAGFVVSSHGKVHAIVVEDGHGDQITAVITAIPGEESGFRRLAIDVEFPKHLARQCVESTNPTVSLSHHDLGLSHRLNDERTSELRVQNVFAR